jgi:hypothetical protein
VHILRRLTLVDLALIAALIVTGILWLNARSSVPSEDAIIANLDIAAWQQATADAADATAAGNLPGVQSALARAADIAEAAGDTGAATGIRSFSASLTGIDIGAVEQALIALDPFPNRRLFRLAYLAMWEPLFYPSMPTSPPEPEREWAHMNVLEPGASVAQYWGTAHWYLPESVDDSAGEADVVFPELGLTGKLMFAVDGDTIQMTLVFTGPFDGEEATGAAGFWTALGNEETLLIGEPLLVGDGVAIMVLSPRARDENVELLQTAEEIGLGIDFAGDRHFVLRIEIGESGRELFRESLGNGAL